jgi:hypothetical protein
MKEYNIPLTDGEINTIYFTTKQYVLNNCDVDYLEELTTQNEKDWKPELGLIKKFKIL